MGFGCEGMDVRSSKGPEGVDIKLLVTPEGKGVDGGGTGWNESGILRCKL